MGCQPSTFAKEEKNQTWRRVAEDHFVLTEEEKTFLDKVDENDEEGVTSVVRGIVRARWQRRREHAVAPDARDERMKDALSLIEIT